MGVDLWTTEGIVFICHRDKPAMALVTGTVCPKCDKETESKFCAECGAETIAWGCQEQEDWWKLPDRIQEKNGHKLRHIHDSVSGDPIISENVHIFDVDCYRQPSAAPVLEQHGRNDGESNFCTIYDHGANGASLADKVAKFESDNAEWKKKLLKYYDRVEARYCKYGYWS